MSIGCAVQYIYQAEISSRWVETKVVGQARTTLNNEEGWYWGRVEDRVTTTLLQGKVKGIQNGKYCNTGTYY